MANWLSKLFGWFGRSSPAPAAAAKAEPKQVRVVKVTPAAVKKIRQDKPADKPEGVRIFQDPPGGGAFAYRMEFDDKVDPEKDFVDQSCGLTVIVPKNQRVYLQGTVLDYLSRPDGPCGFFFTNPNDK